MLKEKKLLIQDYIKGDRFEINAYLTYLFNQVKRGSSNQWGKRA